jgi:AcrR family transcriptional regulator
VDAALQVADRVGVDATTIRLVAAAVGVAPMSLYTHFSKKEQLLDLMFQEVTLRLYADAGQPTWQAELTSLCHQIRSVLLEHPRWVPLLHRPAPSTAVPLRERLLPLMASEGISEADALTALASAGFVSIGLTLVELSFKAPDGKSSLTARFA